MTIIDLADGRHLDIEIDGPADGTPLVMHHGTPGSKVASAKQVRPFHERGLRTVRWSRPGYGSSTRQPGRTVADVADDVAAILDHLGVARCVTAGWSGGGPHALATAARLPDRVAGVLVVGGLAPYGHPDLDFVAGMGESNAANFRAALRDEGEYRARIEADAAVILGGADADRLIEMWGDVYVDVDRVALTADRSGEWAASTLEGLRPGVDGWADDELAFLRPWGFELAEIAVPAFVWHGELDLAVPVTHGRFVAARIPGVSAHFEPGHGHVSITPAFRDAMCDELLAASRLAG